MKVSNGRLAIPFAGRCCFGTWNVEGLTDIKLYQLCRIMRLRSIAILCLQETHDSNSICRCLEGGYLLINSGADDNRRTYAGVGFLLAPWLRSAIYSYKQISERICTIKIRVSGGKLGIVNNYVPHSGYDYGIRQRHFSEVRDAYESLSCHGLKIVVGEFNARLHAQTAGEREVLGPHCFGNPLFCQTPESNRELLMEACTATGLCVANSFVPDSDEHLVTYHHIWQDPAGPISRSRSGFAQLDMPLVPLRVTFIGSDRWQAFASHHFLLEGALAVDVERKSGSRPKRYDITALHTSPSTKNMFASYFDVLANNDATVDDASLDNSSSSFSNRVQEAMEATLPELKATPKRPWIGNRTLDLVNQRDLARKHRQRPLEVALNKQIRTSAKRDRAVWLSGVTTGGSWSAIRQLRRPRPPQRGKLNNLDGVAVESHERAETLADHLEKVQWAVRPSVAAPTAAESCPDVLPTCEGPITSMEVQAAVQRLKTGKAVVEVSAEVLKAICERMDGSGACWLTKVMQLCWDTKSTPTRWHLAQVRCVYKKGDPANCDNYRPISLVSVLYKVYATILLNRLKAGGAESKLWSTQFGFRSGRSTEHALFVVRRRIEQAWASRGGALLMVALDWRKAFDSLAPHRLIEALQRFGIPEGMVQAIAGIYEERVFTVTENGLESTQRPQDAGISQGCPLSPFLFGIGV